MSSGHEMNRRPRTPQSFAALYGAIFELSMLRDLLAEMAGAIDDFDAACLWLQLDAAEHEALRLLKTVEARTPARSH